MKISIKRSERKAASKEFIFPCIVSYHVREPDYMYESCLYATVLALNRNTGIVLEAGQMAVGEPGMSLKAGEVIVNGWQNFDDEREWEVKTNLAVTFEQDEPISSS